MAVIVSVNEKLFEQQKLQNHTNYHLSLVH